MTTFPHFHISTRAATKVVGSVALMEFVRSQSTQRDGVQDFAIASLDNCTHFHRLDCVHLFIASRKVKNHGDDSNS